MNKRQLKKLKTELDDLTKRVDALTIFFLTETYKRLPLYEKELLNRQAEGMRIYIYYLAKRVKLYSEIYLKGVKTVYERSDDIV